MGHAHQLAVSASCAATVPVELRIREIGLAAFVRRDLGEFAEHLFLRNIVAVKLGFELDRLVAQGRVAVPPCCEPDLASTKFTFRMSVSTAASNPSKPSGPVGSSSQTISRSPSISVSVLVILRAVGGRYIRCVRDEEPDALAAQLLPRLLPVNQRMQAPAEPRCCGVRLYHQAVPSRRIAKQEAL